MDNDKTIPMRIEARKAETSLNRLREGIEKHRDIKVLRDMTFWEGDEELYKLLEKER